MIIRISNAFHVSICMVRLCSYYDVFLKKYQELAVERKWKQPLLSMSIDFSFILCFFKLVHVLLSFSLHMVCRCFTIEAFGLYHVQRPATLALVMPFNLDSGLSYEGP